MSKAKQKKDSGKNYTKEEIYSIFEYEKENGIMDTYEDGILYAPIHLTKTGKHRSGHALYMCAWRIREGKYNHIL